MVKCPICKKTKSGRGVPFTEKSLNQHIKDIHPNELTEWDDPALEMADLLAGDESDGVFWGVAYEHGYFGDQSEDDDG